MTTPSNMRSRPPERNKLTDKRQSVRIACNACRSRKAACDGGRPSCTPCAKRRSDCTYDTERDGESRIGALRRENRALRQDVQRLNKDLGTLLGAYGTGMDSADALPGPSSISRSVDGRSFYLEDYSHLSSPLSSNETMRSLSWPTGSPLEYELTVKHAAAYPPIQPIANYQKTAEFILSPVRRSPDPFPQIPPAGITLCDDRLERLQISRWTRVPVSNQYAAVVISLYLETEHPTTGMFDADLFVGDLIDGRDRFCSALLVDAILFHESQAYSTFNVTSSALSALFFTEFNTRWQAENGTDSLLAIAALQVAVHGCAVNGFDKQGRTLRISCREMAERMMLQSRKVTHSETGKDLLDEQDRFVSHIAWGYFSAATAFAFYYHDLPPQAPVSLPLPGTPSFQLPTYMGQTFPALCRLWIICQDIMVSYNAPEDSRPPEDRLSLLFLEVKYQELLAWADELPESGKWTQYAPHHVETMYIWYHAAIVFLFRPWVGKGLVLTTFISLRSSPDDISRASMRQLRNLALRFTSTATPQAIPQARYCLQWHPALLYVANDVLTNPHDPEWKFFFFACLQGYEDLYVGFPLAALCFKGLLTMAIETGKVSARQARRLINQLEQRGKHHPSVNPSDSAMRLRLGSESIQPEGTVEDLVRRFEEVAAFDESINMEMFEPGDDGALGDGDHVYEPSDFQNVER